MRCHLSILTTYLSDKVHFHFRIVEHLQELGEEAEYLALWLDCDREGENIGFEVISLVSQWIPYDNVYRANFSALTNTELSHAYENLGHPDKYMAMSVDARQELDLKIGVRINMLLLFDKQGRRRWVGSVGNFPFWQTIQISYLNQRVQIMAPTLLLAHPALCSFLRP